MLTFAKRTIIVFVLVIVLFGIGYFFGRVVVPVQEITRDKILAEIDQRVEEKIRAGTLLLHNIGVIGEEPVREKTFLSGEVMAPGIEADRFKVKVINHFKGGSFTEFLFQPDYFVKEIIVDQETKINKIILPAFPEIPKIPEMMLEPEAFELATEEEEFIDPFIPEEKEITLAQLKEKITNSIQANQPLHLSIEARQSFVFGEDKSIIANSISFHEILEPF